MAKISFLLLLYAASGYAASSSDNYFDALARFYDAGRADVAGGSQEYRVYVENSKLTCTIKGRSIGYESICKIKNNRAFENLKLNITSDSVTFICRNENTRVVFSSNLDKKPICRNTLLVTSNKKYFSIQAANNKANILTWETYFGGNINRFLDMFNMVETATLNDKYNRFEIRNSKKKFEVSKLERGINWTKNPFSAEETFKWYKLLGLLATARNSSHSVILNRDIQIVFDVTKRTKLEIISLKNNLVTKIDTSSHTINCENRFGNQLRSIECPHVELASKQPESLPRVLRISSEELLLKVNMHKNGVYLTWGTYNLSLSENEVSLSRDSIQKKIEFRFLPEWNSPQIYTATIIGTRKLSPFKFPEVKKEPMEEALKQTDNAATKKPLKQIAIGALALGVSCSSLVAITFIRKRTA